MSFERSLSILDDIEKEINREARALSINLLTGLTKVTPVGNPDLWVYTHPTRGVIDYIGYFGYPDGYVGGSARGNWFVGVNTTNRSVMPGRDKVSAISDGISDINKASKLKYPTITISNNLPYIERLNDGWSTQAPPKFVESEIDRVVNARLLNVR